MATTDPKNRMQVFKNKGKDQEVSYLCGPGSNLAEKRGIDGETGVFEMNFHDLLFTDGHLYSRLLSNPKFRRHLKPINLLEFSTK